MTFGVAGKRFKDDMHHQDAYYEETLKDAVNKAFEISEPGDIILLSHQQVHLMNSRVMKKEEEFSNNM